MVIVISFDYLLHLDIYDCCGGFFTFIFFSVFYMCWLCIFVAIIWWFYLIIPNIINKRNNKYDIYNKYIILINIYLYYVIYLYKINIQYNK